MTWDQVFREMTQATENGCPALRVVIAESDSAGDNIEFLRLQIEGDATAFSQEPADLMAYRIKNTGTSTIYVKASDATDPNTTPGTTPVVWEQQVPAGGFVWESNTGESQHRFDTAITIWATTVATDTGTQTAPTVDSVTVTLYWRTLQ